MSGSKCNVCRRTIAKNHRFIHCHACESKVHLTCNKTDAKTFNKMKTENLPQICLQCRMQVVPPQKTQDSQNSSVRDSISGQSFSNLKIKCSECKKTIAKNHRYINCQSCKSDVHITCNQTDAKTYNKIINEKGSISCIKCQSNIPFKNLTDTEFFALNNTFIEPPIACNRVKCSVCNKTIAKNHRNIKCQSCNSQVHINCNKTDVKTYNKIIKENLPQFCFECDEKTCSSKGLILNTKIHCGICSKTIAKNHRNIQCFYCSAKVHIKCNKTDVKTYNKINKENQQIMCINCQTENIPFQNLTDLQFCAVNKGLNTDTEVLQEVSVTSTSLKTFFKEINNTNPFEHLDLDNEEDENAALINCKYEDLCSFNYKPQKGVFSLFHTNIGSLAKHKDELETILTMLNYKFDIIGISETKLSKNIRPKFDINIEGYKCYHVDTEANKGGTLIYVSNTINSKARPDLDSLLYKSEVLESTFIEIISPKKKNILVGCIYRHPSMDLEVFNKDYLTPFLEIFEKENKKKYLIGDFNVDLLKIDDDNKSSSFFDNLTSNLFVPHIIHPTRITSTTKTLIDNIYSNSTNYKEGLSGNLTVSLSDHLAQFLIIPDECHHSTKNQNLFTRDTKNLDSANFIREFQNIEWSNILKLHCNDPNISFDGFQSTVDNLVDTYLPKRKMTKNEIKKKEKPWISIEILKLIRTREKLHKQYIKAENDVIKSLFLERYKTVRNKIVSLCRQSKKHYYQKYFETNSLNLRNTWRGIRSIINLREKAKSSPSSLMINGEVNTEPSKIANEFNNYFSSIADKLQASIHPQGQNFNSYLKNKSDCSFLSKLQISMKLLILLTPI